MQLAKLWAVIDRLHWESGLTAYLSSPGAIFISHVINSVE